MNLSKPLLRFSIPLLFLPALLLITSRLPTSARSPETVQTAPSYEQSLLQPADLTAAGMFGAAVALDGDLLAVGDVYGTVDGLDDGAVYLFERDPQSPTGWMEVKKLHRDPPESGGYYGASLALQGDTLVVGNPSDTRDGSALWQGAAYVYERNEGGSNNWGLVASLVDENTGAFRRFGHAVAVDGDLIAASAPGENGDRGKVYLYSRAAGWARIEDFSDPAGETFDWFGASVALDGDTLVVGAWATDLDTANSDTGAAFLFERNEGGADQWGQVARLVADLPQSDSLFGSVVAVEDGTVVVTAFNEARYDENGQLTEHQVGAAYLYGRDQGGPGAWGLLAALRPDSATTFDRFGKGLALDGDHLWIGAPNTNVPGGFGGEGSVYHFLRDEGGANAWGLVSSFAADPDGTNAAFGSALSADGGALLAGAPEHEAQGAAYYITATEEPESAAVFFPLQMQGWAPPTGTLNDGASLEEPGGAIVGVVPGTLDAPLQATIVEALPPGEALPPDFLPRGAYYRLAAERLAIAPGDKPILVGLPVPAGTDTSRLAVASYIPDGLESESDEPEAPTRTWRTLPGSYDSATNLFVVTMRALLPEGVTLVLFEHPDNAPLPPAGQAAAQAPLQAAVVEYRVSCDPAAQDTSECTQDNYALVSNELLNAHTSFVDDHGFKSPALVHSVGVFVGPDKRPQLSETSYYVIVSTKPCLNSSGDAILGQYSYMTQQILVCIGASDSIELIRATIRHELFHAIQASYTNLAHDRMKKETRKLSHWLVEGTASLAEESEFTLLRSLLRDTRMATEPLTSTVALNEYQVQDYWNFAGLEGNLPGTGNLTFLPPIFEHGATPENVSLMMDVGGLYWEWAKNQVIEHYQPLTDAFQSGPCELEPAAYDPAQVKVLDYPAEVFVEGELPPLTSALVEIRVGLNRSSMPVFASNNADRDDLRFKAYVNGESGCQDVPDGQRFLLNVPAGARRYVLVSNISLTDTFTYTVYVD